MSTNADPNAAPPQEVTPAPEPDQAHLLYDGLRSADRRNETLGQVLQPGLDLPPGMTWEQARQALWQQGAPQPEPQPDPFEQAFGPEPQILGYDAQGQPVYDQPYQPQQQGFDPRQLAPVFDSFGEQIKSSILEQVKQEIQQSLMAQAGQQAFDTAFQQNASDLSAPMQQAVRLMAQEAMKTDRRSPAEVIADVKAQLTGAQNAQAAQAAGPTLPGQPAAQGMTPGDQIPTSIAEAMRTGGGLR